VILLEKQMRINLEDIRKNVEQRREWNSARLDRIEFYEDGVQLDIPIELIDEFEFTGLNNIDFITTGFYLQKEKKENKK